GASTRRRSRSRGRAAFAAANRPARARRTTPSRGRRATSGAHRSVAGSASPRRGRRDPRPPADREGVGRRRAPAAAPARSTRPAGARLAIAPRSCSRWTHVVHRIFLLSPASTSGRRAGLLLNERAAFELAVHVRARAGAPLGDVFSFLSGLYFRGKLT